MKKTMFDFKKERKDLYAPSTHPSIIDVPEMKFIMVDGMGCPNSGAEYAEAVQILYALSYAIKMGNKDKLEYVVAPLEGYWEVADKDYRGGAPIKDKSKFVWTMMIRQPDFVTQDIFEKAKHAIAKKKPSLDISKARLETLTEGLVVQALHVGSYDDEVATVKTIDEFAISQGYELDMANGRRHHEIYLSDPRKVEVSKLKTIIRHPIKGGQRCK